MVKKFHAPSPTLLIILIGLGHLSLMITLGEDFDIPLIRIARAGLGILYVLFVPGFLIQLSLYPKRSEVEDYDRLALSFGLSIAILSPLTLILNQFEGGLQEQLFTRAWLVLTLVLLIVTAARQMRLAPKTQAGVWARLPNRKLLQGQNRYTKGLLIMASLSLLIALGAGIGLALLPMPGSAYTEFYILGEEGMAERYPKNLQVNQPAAITVGINNLEGKTMLYSLEARDGSGIIGKLEAIILEEGARKEFQFSITPQLLGEDVQIDIALFRYGRNEAYRRLRLITTVTDSSNWE